MSQMWHIVRKDLRRLRWVWLAWCALVVADTVVRVISAPVAFSGLGPRQAIAQIATTLGILHVGLSVVIVSAVVHDEPLVGEDAFWVTRPIERGSLMAAKVLLLGTALIILPILSELAVMTAFSARRSEMAAAMPPLALERAQWLSPLLALAVLSRNLTHYVLTVAGAVAALAALIAVTFTVLLLRAREDASTAGEASFPDPTIGLIRGLTFVAMIMLVVGYQYYRRRRGRSMVIAALGLTAVAVLPGLWPWSLAAVPAARNLALPANFGNVDVVVDAESTPRLSENFGLDFNRTPSRPLHQVSARMSVTGMAPDLDVQPIVRRMRFTAPGLAPIDRSEQRIAYVSLSSSGGRSSSRTMAAALGGVTMLTERPRSQWDDWTNVLRLDDDQLARVAGQSGNLDLDVLVLLSQTVLVSSVSLQSGSAAESERYRFKNLRVVPRPNGCVVLLRETHVAPLIAWPNDRQFSYVLINRSRREAVEGGFAQDLTPRFALGAFGFEPAVGRTGFVVREMELQFPVRYGPETLSSTIDAGWLADAELAILEARPSGGVDRTVAVRGFRIPTRRAARQVGG